ncbi:MAG: hypothetical protein WBA12_04905 [Catalinimonas sp.]
MTKLHAGWLTEGLIDFEYKRYLLLAYFQQVEACFHQQHLYPTMSDLVFHYRNLLQVRDNKQLLRENFPKEISKADFRKLRLVYEEMIEEGAVMRELEEIIQYSVPEFQRYLEAGRALYRFVEEGLQISPVGLTPLNPSSGYVFLLPHGEGDTNVYEYQVTIFEGADETFRGIRMQFLESVRKQRTYTYEALKVDLTRRYRNLSHTAAYLIEARVPCPVNETLLPVAKRSLVKYLATAA